MTKSEVGVVPDPTDPRTDCACFWTDPSTWTYYGSAVEPGSQMEYNPECPVHGTPPLDLAQLRLAKSAEPPWAVINLRAAADEIERDRAELVGLRAELEAARADALTEAADDWQRESGWASDYVADWLRARSQVGAAVQTEPQPGFDPTWDSSGLPKAYQPPPMPTPDLTPSMPIPLTEPQHEPHPHACDCSFQEADEMTRPHHSWCASQCPIGVAGLTVDKEGQQ